jgi:antitoxin CcdA
MIPAGLVLDAIDRQPQSLCVPAQRRRKRNIERALETTTVETEQASWLDDNKEAIAQYNAFVEEHGYFGEEFREF